MTSFLYRLARVLNTINAVFGGPGKAANRGKNILVGRAIGRSGVWRRWW